MCVYPEALAPRLIVSRHVSSFEIVGGFCLESRHLGFSRLDGAMPLAARWLARLSQLVRLLHTKPHDVLIGHAFCEPRVDAVLLRPEVSRESNRE